MRIRDDSARRINAWCLYDAGNSAFATTIMAAILPVYFREVAAAGLPANLPSALWGYTSSLSLLFGAFLAPILGSIADVSGSKKHFLSAFTLLGVFSTALLFFIGKGDWLPALALYAIGSLGFSLSMIFYDALLPHIAPPGQMDMVSSRGYAWGYIGGGTLLAANLAAAALLPGTLGARLSFVSVAVWWSVFTIPLLLFIPEPPSEGPRPKGSREVFAQGFRRLAGTFRQMRNYRELLIFLAAYWLYNDGVGTIMKMAAIYGAEKGIGMMHLVGALLVTQFVGAPFSILFGRLSLRFGGKTAITIGLAWYSVISLGAFFLEKAWHFWVLAIAVGMVQGGVQAISRSTYGMMVPRAKTGEFFAFYDVFSKFSGVAGPALFALLTQISGSTRLGIASLVLFFVGGIYLLQRVNVEKGIAKAGNHP
ncbi:MAG: MFS transporter [Thermovirgaceae bacterium]|nr:MFS transporter [Thermovirgaceae bacterium]